LYSSYWQNIWATDAGYLPWFQRLISVLTVKVFNGVEQFALVTQISAMFFIAFFASIINFTVFRKIFPSDLLRFILGISIAFIPDYEVHAFINFIYFGIVPALLFLFINKEKMNRFIFWISAVFLTLVMMSKPHFLSFAPLLVIIGWYAYQKKQKRTLAFSILVLTSFLLQIISLKLNPSVWDKDASLAEMIGQVAYSWLSMYKHVFLGDYMFTSLPSFILFLILLITALFLFVKNQLAKKDKTILYFFLVCNYIACITVIMTIVTAKEIFPPEMPIWGMPNDRHFIFTNISVLLAGIVVLQTFVKKKPILLSVVALLLLNSSAFTFFYDKKVPTVTNRAEAFQPNSTIDPYQDPKRSYSQWKLYSPMLQNERYCIPINPYPFLLSKECTYLSEYKINTNVTKKEERIVIPQESRSEQWQIQGIILVNELQKNAFDRLKLVAYSADGTVQATAKQITPDSTYSYIYFLFPKPAEKIAYMRFYNDDKILRITPTVLYLGTKNIYE
jgi:hypothetical protein